MVSFMTDDKAHDHPEPIPPPNKIKNEEAKFFPKA